MDCGEEEEGEQQKWEMYLLEGITKASIHDMDRSGGGCQIRGLTVACVGDVARASKALAARKGQPKYMLLSQGEHLPCI